MSNKILIILVLSLIVGIVLITFYSSRQKQIAHSLTDASSTLMVVISTDKTEYDKGQIIEITVNNGLDRSILYHIGPANSFWGIEYFKDDKWINPRYERNGGFQLTEKNVGDVCSIAYYERMAPDELESHSYISHQWNQKICPFRGSTESKIVEYIDSGQYRLVFYYGFNISSDDSYSLSEIQTVYSNTFIIK